MILVRLALATILILLPVAPPQTAGDFVLGGDAATRVYQIAGDVVPGGS